MKRQFLIKLFVGSLMMLFMAVGHSHVPVWTFAPLTATTITVAENETATVKYQVTNQSRKKHTLIMNPITGMTQVTTLGNCPNPFILEHKQSCTLNLSINGSALNGSVMEGPVVCEQGNPNQCYQPSAANSLKINKGQLISSVSQLALSVTGLTEYGVSGNPPSGLPRVIVITNTGTTSANNLAVNPPVWPAGTTSSTTCGTSLAAGASCTITITPGATATSDCSNSATAPVPGVIQVTADNKNTLSINVVVLGYACIYQGGYVYFFDDTTPDVKSVGGKVAATSDQASAFPNGIIWSSNGGTGGGSGGSDSADVSFDLIPGINVSSTSAVGLPTYSSFSSFFLSTYVNDNPFSPASFLMCNGATDGSCNTANILIFYNQFITNNTEGAGGSPPFLASAGPTNHTYYAAGLCKQTISTYSDWYLPAVCEMGYGRNGTNRCGTQSTPVSQNMQIALVNSLQLLTGGYWSSTQSGGILQPEKSAFIYDFIPSRTTPVNTTKNLEFGVRCARNLTF